MGTKLVIEIDENTLREIVLKHLANITGIENLQVKDVLIEVKTKQNYRTAEWENGAFRARIDKSM